MHEKGTLVSPERPDNARGSATILDTIGTVGINFVCMGRSKRAKNNYRGFAYK